MNELPIPKMPDDLIHQAQFQHVFEEERQAARMTSSFQEPMLLLVKALQRYAAIHPRLRETCLLFYVLPDSGIVVVYDRHSALRFVAPTWLA